MTNGSFKNKWSGVAPRELHDPLRRNLRGSGSTHDFPFVLKILEQVWEGQKRV
jgi:hypothetical protein